MIRMTAMACALAAGVLGTPSWAQVGVGAGIGASGSTSPTSPLPGGPSAPMGGGSINGNVSGGTIGAPIDRRIGPTIDTPSPALGVDAAGIESDRRAAEMRRQQDDLRDRQRARDERERDDMLRRSPSSPSGAGSFGMGGSGSFNR